MKPNTIPPSNRMSAIALSAGFAIFFTAPLGAQSPPTVAGFPSALLPPPTGTLDAEQPITFGAPSTVQFNDFSLRLPSTSVEPPDAGTSSTVQFDAKVRLRASNNNGASFQPVTTNAAVTLSLTTSADGSECDAEILALDVSGGGTAQGGGLPPAIRLRESPTLASTGRFSIIRCPDGSCRISSFFDVFTELSIDGGASWTPSPAATRCGGNAPSVETLCPSADLPPAASVHRAVAPVTFANGIVLRSLVVRDPSSSAAPPAPGAAPQFVSSPARCSGQLSLDGGTTFQPFECPASLALQVSNQLDGVVRCFDTEMLALNLAGGSLPPGVMLRESPSKASLGRTSLRESPSGASRISSFFDIFTEISLDGGQNWSPASSGACVCALARDHSFATDNFPCPADYACDSGATTSFGTTGVVIRDFRHRPTADRSPLPADSATTRSLSGDAACDVSLDGGKTYFSVGASCVCQAGFSAPNSSSGGDRPMESLSFDFTCTAGPATVMVRESPTKASTGKIAICHATAGFRISSFFDVFTEVSLDGGQSWTPADSPLQLSLLPYVEQENMFPVGYVFPRGGSYQTHDNEISYALSPAYLIRKLRFSAQQTVTNPLFEEHGTAINPLFSDCSFEFSADGGATWTPVSGPATGSTSVTRVTHEDAWDSVARFDTEMLSMQASVSGGTLGTVMLRESPTKQSLGRCATQRVPDGTACRIDSFFDVFTEVSLDGGASWSPAASAAHLELHALPPDCFTRTDWLPVPLGLASPDRVYAVTVPSGKRLRGFSFDSSPGGVVVTGGAVPPPAPDSSVILTSTMQFSFEYTTNDGAAFSRVQCPATVVVRYSDLVPGDVRSMSCEMLACDLSGGSLPAGMMLRESPTRQSTGKTTISSTTGGHRVSSFFDIFTEVSFDGGQSWEATSSPVRIECRETPHGVLSSSSTQLHLDTLEVAPGGIVPACASSRSLNFTKIEFKRSSSSSVVLPSPGHTTTAFENGTADFLYSADGTSPPTPVRCDVFCRYQISPNGSAYDTEMLQLEYSGGNLPAGVLIRESPTLPSRGMIRESPTLSSTGASAFRVCSFFDVFTELSIDSGRSWQPFDRPTCYQMEDVLVSSNAPDTAWPPPGQFQRGSGDPDFDTAFTNGASVSFFDIFTEASIGRPPLPTTVGASVVHGSYASCHFQLKLSASAPPADVDCDVAFTTQCTAIANFADGASRCDTEMLALSLSGTGLPPGVMIRESPTLQSTGKTTVRAGGGGGGGAGGFQMASFFDVFTELSLDGGQTWSPSAAPMRLQFTSGDIEVTTPQGTPVANDTVPVTVNATIDSSLTITVGEFVVRNTGTGDLDGLTCSFSGVDAALFNLQTPIQNVLQPNATCIITVRFVPISAGMKSGVLHIASNDSDTASFNIPFSVRVLTPGGDEDNDGVSNEDELALTECGLDPVTDSSVAIHHLRDSGFFLSSDLHALALGRPVLQRDPASGHFHLQLGVTKSPDLQSWSTLTDFSSSSNPATGVIDIDIAPDSSNAQFYQLFGTAP